MKTEKCRYHIPSVSFLSYIIESGLVRMDPDKVRAVVDWPKSTSCKDMQWFLWFLNFYCRFIRDYRWVASLPTQLISPALPFLWTPKAEATFAELKRHFTSALIVVQSYASKQFIVKVDASDCSAGTILPQHSEPNQRLHPGDFFCSCLMADNHNYDPSNHVLWAIKLALDELRHWLEGAEHTFTV